MTDRNALLRAVLETPYDDTPRLVFADWLDDTGIARDAARAALIRLQCERAMLAGEQRTPAVVSGYLRQEEAILKRWAAKWLPKVLRPAVPAAMEVRGEIVTVPQLDGYVIFERGFVGWMGFDLDASPGAYNPFVAERPPAYASAIDIATDHVHNVFASNPLAGVSVSFAGTHTVPTMHVEIKQDGPAWLIQFDDESNRWIGSNSGGQITGEQHGATPRHEFGRAITAALRVMLMPLAGVAVATAMVDAFCRRCGAPFFATAAYAAAPGHVCGNCADTLWTDAEADRQANEHDDSQDHTDRVPSPDVPF